MTYEEAVKVLEAHGFKRVYTTHMWWYADESPVVARYCDVGKAVFLTRVHGPSTKFPMFSTHSLSTEWALGRQLTDMGCTCTQ